MQAVSPYDAPITPAFGGGVTDSVLHPIVLGALIVLTLLVLCLPRKYVIGPLLVGVLLVPLGQQVYWAGVHWIVMRIIVLVGLLRVCMIKAGSRDGVFPYGYSPIDNMLVGYVACQAIGVCLFYRFQTSAVINQFGFLIDSLGGYVVIRAFIQDEEAIQRALKWLAGIIVVLAVGMVGEQLLVQNAFGYLGGVPLIPGIREGRIRSQGSFQHSLTAGTFAATLLPLFFLLWSNSRAKLAAVSGMVGCTVMTVCSNSSTPLLAYAAAVTAMCLWPIRRNLRMVRVATAICLVTLHLVMKSPVWWLIARVDLTGSSSGYHRAALVDQFIQHFGDWWLMGTNEAANWGYDLWDQQNEYVGVGEAGGLLALVLFIVMIKRACARLGDARKKVDGQRKETLVWFLGSSLFATLVGFFGINYYDQIKVGWFLQLAIISVATSAIMQANDSDARQDASESPEPFPSVPASSGIDWTQVALHRDAGLRMYDSKAEESV